MVKKVKAMVHPEALKALERMKADQKAGHDAEDYWRGAAAAYFTANPVIQRLPMARLQTTGNKKKPQYGDIISWYKYDSEYRAFRLYKQAVFGTRKGTKLLKDFNDHYQEMIGKILKSKEAPSQQNPFWADAAAGVALGGGWSLAAAGVKALTNAIGLNDKKNDKKG
jgi:hypothetical protein